jgi:heme-degrading monooxygenase HmoA
MKRRMYLKTILGCGAIALAKAANPAKPIQLHVDLSVNSSREQEMLHNFKTIFLPAAKKQDGYIDAKMLKLRTAVQGKTPAGANYRFVLTFASEELRQQWIASDTHKKVWPTVENTLASKDYTVLLYDVL